MAGCFGNSIFDRNMEQQLNEYLRQFDDERLECDTCGFIADIDEWEVEELDKDRVYCPNCGDFVMLNN